MNPVLQTTIALCIQYNSVEFIDIVIVVMLVLDAMYRSVRYKYDDGRECHL